MILDTLDHWTDYGWTQPRFRTAFEYLAGLDPSAADGKYPIDGDNVYCMFQTYQTRPLEGHQFEAHRVYADIQCMVDGEELILWAPTPELTIVKPYEPDIEFYALTPAPTELVLTPGRFCVLFPQDAHAPCTMRNAPATVRKAVIKVRLA